MKLGLLKSLLASLGDQIKDRDPDSVEVLIMNPVAPSMSGVAVTDFSLSLEVFQRFPDPVNPDKPEWCKQIRIEI